MEGRADEAAGGAGAEPVARKAPTKVERSGQTSTKCTPTSNILPRVESNAAAALGTPRLRLSVQWPRASPNPAPGTLPEPRSESPTQDELSAQVISGSPGLSALDPRPERVDGRREREQEETPRSWVDVVNSPHIPSSLHHFLKNHPASTLQSLEEVSRRFGTAPSMPCQNELANRLQSVPSLAIRFHHLTFRALNLQQKKWTRIQTLKDMAAESLTLTLTNHGLKPDNHVRQSITVRFDEISDEGPNASTRVYMEIVLPPSELRDSLIRNCRCHFPSQLSHRPDAKLATVETHPVHESIWESLLPPQSTATFLALAAAIGVKEGDFASVAALASRIIAEKTGLRDVYVRTHNSTGGQRPAIKLIMCADIGGMLDIPACIDVAGAPILMPQLDAKDIREITRCLISQGQICESDISRHLIIGLPPKQWSNRAHETEMDRRVEKDLEEALPAYKARILKERARCSHAVLLSSPTEEGAKRMLEDFSGSRLGSEHSALNRVWNDTEPPPCIRIAGPLRCLQVLTTDQLATLAPRYDWSHRLPRPRGQSSRSVPAPPPRASGLRPGPGPDNPKRAATPTHTW